VKRLRDSLCVHQQHDRAATIGRDYFSPPRILRGAWACSCSN
jgi:hypothetical protein